MAMTEGKTAPAGGGEGTTATKARGFLIGYQILVAMLVIALIPLAGLYYISISKARADWSANILHNLTITTSGLARSVEEWTTMNFLLLQQVSATPAMKSMEASQQNPVLATISKTYPWIYLAHTIQLDGNNAGRSDGKATTFYGDRDYVKKVVSGEPVAQEVVIGKTSKKPALILAVPIVGDASRTLGVASTAMSLEDLSKTVTSTKIGTSGYVILVDERNRLIAHGKGEISSELQDFSSHPGLRKQNEMIIHKDEGKQVIAYSKKTRQGWTLLVQQDYDEAYAAADKARTNALVLLVVTLLFVAAAAYFLAGRLATPIRRLTVVADEISCGKLDAKIGETGRQDEIGALARSIERMGVSLQMAFDRLRKR